jgi:hypothetical protein
MNIDAKKAAAIAAKYYQEILQEPTELSIEEIELDEDGFWLITLGISDYGFGIKPASYKIFKIDANTGEVKSMKIRTIK